MKHDLLKDEILSTDGEFEMLSLKNKKEMMRVLKTPEGEIVLDVTGRKNGRGAYLCFSKECLQKAIKNKGLERSLKMQIPQEVYENLERELDTIEL